MSAPERIWVNLDDNEDGCCPVESDISDAHKFFNPTTATEYILAASPEVQALIADAVKAAVMKSARVRLNKPDKAPNGHYYGTYALGWAAAAKKLRAAIRAGTEGGE